MINYCMSTKPTITCSSNHMSKGEYEKVIKGSGYKTVSLIYTDKNDIEQKRNHSRNIIWLNPPFDLNLDGLFRVFLCGGGGG